MFLWIKKPGTAGDGKREQVAFHDRKLGYLPVGEPICRDIAKQRRAEKADTVSVTTQPGCNLSGLRCDGDGAAAAIRRLCPGLWRYIRGSLVRNGKPQGFRDWQGRRQYLFLCRRCGAYFPYLYAPDLHIVSS